MEMASLFNFPASSNGKENRWNFCSLGVAHSSSLRAARGHFHQEWRGGLEAKYHSAERPRRFNVRRVQVTQPMERSATRFSSTIRLCREALRKSAGWKRPPTRTLHCLLWSAGPRCRQPLRDGAPATVRAESRTSHLGALGGIPDLWVM